MKFNTYAYIHTYIHILYIYIYTYIHTYIIYIHTYIHTYIYILYIYIHTYIYIIYTHTYTYKCMYMDDMCIFACSANCMHAYLFTEAVDTCMFSCMFSCIPVTKTTFKLEQVAQFAECIQQTRGREFCGPVPLQWLMSCTDYSYSCEGQMMQDLDIRVLNAICSSNSACGRSALRERRTKKSMMYRRVFAAAYNHSDFEN